MSYHLSALRLLVVTALFGAVIPSCSSGGAGQSSGEVITSLEDLDGKTISVLSGSVQDLIASESCPNASILRAETDADSYLLVESGKAVAQVGSSISWQLASKGYENIVQVGEGFKPLPIGIAFDKKQSDLLTKFNAFLAQFQTENDLNAFIDDWMDPNSTRPMPKPEPSGTVGKLTFATSAIVPPFDFIRNGEVCGAEAELLARFAQSLNMDWEFVNVSFSGLINFIQSGKAVAGASIMCVTKERLESVNFSNPWMEEFSIILVNRKYAPGAEVKDDDGKGFFQSVRESFYKTLVKEDRYKMILEGLWSTIVISLLATILGTLLGMLLCFTSMHRNKLLKGFSNGYIEFMRCMPQVVFLMIMFYIIFAQSSLSGLWVATISFSLCFAAYSSVIFRSAVQSIDKGQSEAALAMGFGRARAFWNIVFPQAVQRALPVYKGEVIGLVKATSIVGYIAVFDLTKAGDVIRSRTYEAFFPLILITVIYFLVIWVFTLILKSLEKKTQPERKKFHK